MVRKLCWARLGTGFAIGGRLVDEPEIWKQSPAQFGDRVKIRTVAETEKAGIAGRSGVVYGASVTGVEVIGSTKEDVALNVTIDESEETVWIAPYLVEFTDHYAGATITLPVMRCTSSRRYRVEHSMALVTHLLPM